MLKVNLWQKLLRVRFEREPVKRAQKVRKEQSWLQTGSVERRRCNSSSGERGW